MRKNWLKFAIFSLLFFIKIIKIFSLKKWIKLVNKLGYRSIITYFAINFNKIKNTKKIVKQQAIFTIKLG